MDHEQQWLTFGYGRTVDLGDMPPMFDAAIRLIEFSNDMEFSGDSAFRQLVGATICRSETTFRGITSLLMDGMHVQAAMLARSLYEDVIVGHWLVLNSDDPQWLVDRFFRQRATIELHRQHLSSTLEWTLPTVGGVDLQAARSSRNALQKEFGADARRNWWDPGQDGVGGGRPIGLGGVAGLLEDAAATHRRFHPRFAGGDEALLRRIEAVHQKWFSQCLHHTAVGLPFVVSDGEALVGIEPQFETLAFTSSWLFAQQIYLAYDLFEAASDDFDLVFKAALISGWGMTEADFKPFSAPETTPR